MSHKIGVQLQSGTAPDYDALIRLPLRTIKFLGNALDVGMVEKARLALPNASIVLRFAGGDQDYRKHPSIYADKCLRVFAPFQRVLEGSDYYVEHINEPAFRDKLDPVKSIEDAKAMSAHAVGFSQTMRANGYKTIAYNFSVGVPALDVYDGKDVGIWDYLVPGIMASDALGLHEYSAPRMTDWQGGLCFRYRLAVEELRPLLGKAPNIFLTECGIDRGVIAGRLGGYRTPENNTSIADYVNDLGWYATGLAQDPYILGAHMFLYGASDNQRWGTFDVAEDEADRRTFFAFLQWTPPSGEPPPPPPVNGGVMPTPLERLEAVWNHEGIPYNPDAAFPKKARELGLGRPTATEYRYMVNGDTYAGQGFDAAFLECREGDWDNAKPYDWLTGEPYKAPTTPPPTDGSLPPYVFPDILRQEGFVGTEGVPLHGKVFYRISPTASVLTGVSAFCEIVVYGANKVALPGAQVVSRRADGKGEVITTGGDGKVRFYFGAGSAFTPPTIPPFEIFVAEGAVKNDETKLVSWSARLSDAVFLGDSRGEHTESYVQFVGYQQ